MRNNTKLTLFDFTMIVVSLVIGMGIFRTPLNVAKAVPSTFIFFAAWIAGGLVALCGALTYAEIGSRLPVTGGYYRVFQYAYHPSIAFAVNCLILVSNAASLAGVAIVGGEYISGIILPASQNASWRSVPENAATLLIFQNSIAITAILIFYGINLLGLKMSAKTQNVLTIVKISLIVLLITPIFFRSAGPAPVSHLVSSAAPGFLGYLKAFGVGLVAVSFTYGGYQQTINFGGEVKDPTRNISRGIFFGIFIIIALYLTINYAYIHVIGFENLQNSRNIAAIMASKIFGAGAEKLLSVLLFLSVLAYVNVLLMSNPRVMFAMSEDGILPAIFRKVNARTGAITVSLSVFAAICIVLVLGFKGFDRILSFSIFLDCFGMILSAGSIFMLRKKTPQLDNSGIFTMKLYPLQPVIFILAYSFVAVSLLINETSTSLVGLAVLTGFIILYFLVQASQKNKIA